MRRALLAAVAAVAAAMLATGCGKASNDFPDAHPADAVIACASGPQHCDGKTLQTCVDGTYHDQQVCPDACSDTFGCVLCVPGTGICDGTDLSHTCNATGTGYVDVACDPVQGMTCGVASGVCEGACAPQNIGHSYIGCEYFPTVTGNMVSSDYLFAVAVANTTGVLATVRIEDGSLPQADVFTVPPNSVRVEKLPWHASLKLCLKPTWGECVHGAQADGALAPRGAYHLRSTVPVTVYQFNPLDYSLPSAADNSYSNDASLLLPASAWRAQYFAASWIGAYGNPSELAVTAWHDDTKVTLTTRASTLAGGGAPAFTAGVPQTITLGAGDVVEITSRDADLTGSQIVADKPVQVISGHYCANVPVDKNFCDHLEESMFSVDALGTKYVVTAPAVTTSANGKIETVRVIATTAGTQLTYDPPQPNAPAAIANAGDFVELPGTVASFVVTANHKVMVAQYMEGSSTTSDATGDPSLALAVPVEQFRSTYLFHAPTNYETNYVDVVAPTAAVVMLDGKVLAFKKIATTGYGLARVTPLDDGPLADGNHAITGSMPFGITVYGYGTDTSYWYPGGLELNDIPVN